MKQSKVILNDRAAYNGRFGASGGVAPQKMKWEHER